MQSSWRLFAFERRWLLEMFACLIPSGASVGLGLGARDAPLGRFVDELVALAPLHVVLGLRFAIWTVLLAPLVIFGRPRTWLGLPEQERLATLQNLRGSSFYLVREIPLLLKTLAFLGFGGLPEVQAALGIEPRDASAPSWAAEAPTAGDDP